MFRFCKVIIDQVLKRIDLWNRKKKELVKTMLPYDLQVLKNSCISSCGQRIPTLNKPTTSASPTNVGFSIKAHQA